MKRLIIAVSLFVAAITFCVVGNLIITDATDELAACFEQCSVKEDNKKLYGAKVNKALGMWEEKKAVFDIFLPENELEELENNMDELNFFVKNSDYSQCPQVCFASFKILKRINGGFSPGIRSIL